MQLSVFFINNIVYILWRSVADYITIVVTIAWRIHLFSFRTQKLSFSAPKVLVGWPTGRIGRCHIIFLDSSAAEHPAVNRRVVGSNPTRGAIWIDLEIWTLIVRFQGLFICENAGYSWWKSPVQGCISNRTVNCKKYRNYESTIIL